MPFSQSKPSASGGPQTVYVQDADPGAVGAGKVWVDTTLSPPRFYIRSSSNANWALRLANAFGEFKIDNTTALLQGADGAADTAGIAARLYGGDGNDGDGAGARVEALAGAADGTDGRLRFTTVNDSGSDGQAIVSDGNTTSKWGGVKTGSGAPSGAPSGFLPLYLDGSNLYVWDGAAWRGPYVP
jgi:hypothetical protein